MGDLILTSEDDDPARLVRALMKAQLAKMPPGLTLSGRWLAQQKRAAVKLAELHGEPEIRVAAKGMSKIFPWQKTCQPWYLPDLLARFEEAYVAEVYDETETRVAETREARINGSTVWRDVRPGVGGDARSLGQAREVGRERLLPGTQAP
jgi:hypothetical protein